MSLARERRPWIPGLHRALIGAALVGMLLVPLNARQARAQATVPTTYSVVHNFTGLAGADVYSGVIADAAGNLYGAAYRAGVSGYGLVFKMDPSGKETVLYNFTGGSDGGNPFASLIQDGAGNLYGTTVGGGNNGSGVVFKLDPSGHETVLYTFTGGPDGASPEGSLIRDEEGSLYGTTAFGGDASCACGVVFKLDSSGQETVLHTFKGVPDGAFPEAALVRDAAGNLYGTTVNGGSTDGACREVSGCGVVFKVTPSAEEMVLHSFVEDPGGAFPVAGLIEDSSGNLYGTTFGGGNTSLGCNSGSGCGVVFRLDPQGHETVLYTFNGGRDGWGPAASLLLADNGDLFGTTDLGGSLSVGVVFRLSPAGKEIVLHTFSFADGMFPVAGLVQSKGQLFGTTSQGGTHGHGTLFRLQR